MPGDSHDPRTTEEKARADLKRNSEMGLAPKQSPLTREPSVTDGTFGANTGRPPEAIRQEEAANPTRTDEDASRRGTGPGEPNDPTRGGYHHADSRMGHSHSDKVGDLERTITNSDDPNEGLPDRLKNQER